MNSGAREPVDPVLAEAPGEPPRQPHYFQVAARLALEAAARLNAVEIAINVKFEQNRRVVAGTSRRLRLDAREAEGPQIKRIDEHIDRANRIALADPIIKAFRQQRRLLAIRPLNKTLHHPPAIQ